MDRARGLAVVAGLAGALFVVAVIGIVVADRQHRALSPGAPVTAGVVAGASSGYRTSDVVTVRFTVGGDERTSRIEVHHRLPVGTAVQVRYDPHSPGTAELAGADEADNNRPSTGLFTGFAVVTGIGAVVLAVLAARARRAPSG